MIRCLIDLKIHAVEEKIKTSRCTYSIISGKVHVYLRNMVFKYEGKYICVKYSVGRTVRLLGVYLCFLFYFNFLKVEV